MMERRINKVEGNKVQISTRSVQGSSGYIVFDDILLPGQYKYCILGRLWHGIRKQLVLSYDLDMVGLFTYNPADSQVSGVFLLNLAHIEGKKITSADYTARFIQNFPMIVDSFRDIVWKFIHEGDYYERYLAIVKKTDEIRKSDAPCDECLAYLATMSDEIADSLLIAENLKKPKKLKVAKSKKKGVEPPTETKEKSRHERENHSANLREDLKF